MVLDLVNFACWSAIRTHTCMGCSPAYACSISTRRQCSDRVHG
jgi:hypothetical protein